MKPTLVKYLRDHSAKGIWSGSVEAGVPVVRIKGEFTPAEPFLKQLGIELAKSNKYTESVKDAGMGKTQFGGNTPDAGNGISQEQE